MNCNPKHAKRRRLNALVSIPNRDFDELQCKKANLVPALHLVSIPNRDFDELQYILMFYVSLIN